MRKIVAGAVFPLAVAFVGLNQAPALAQATGQQAGVEEVVVTATRRAENLSKVPASISAFTSEKMEQINAKDFGDLVHFMPGVTFDQESNNVSIRGVNSTAGDATTGIYIDDTPIQIRELGFGSDNTLPAVFDLERVEVLRGPQGTLFGAGSEGGTVRYITPQPGLQDYSVYAKTEISTTEYGEPNYEAGLAVGGPIVEDKLGFRVSGWWRYDGGYIDRVDYLTGATIDKDSNHANTMVFRAALGWQPASNITITPSFFFQNRDIHNDDEYWVGLSNPDKGIYKTGTPELMGNRDHFALPALKIDWDLGGAELISNTSYFDRTQYVQDYSGTLYDLSYFQQSADFGLNPDFVTPCTGGLCKTYFDNFVNHGLDAPPLLDAAGIDLPGFGHFRSQNVVTNTQQNWTQEARLQSNDPNARFTWLVGVFYTGQTQLSVEEIRDPQLPALTQFLWGDSMLDIWGEDLLPNGDDYINHTLGHERQLAAFANGTYALTDTLKIQAGVRVASTHFDFQNFSDGPQNFGPGAPNSGKQDETPVTPMGNLTWQFTDDDMLYATVAKGYRIGGANPQFPVSACTEITSEPTSYNSDTVMSYEAGSKDKFLDGRLELSGSAYYLQWSNIQQSVTLPSCGFRFTTNQGAAVSRGFDLQGEWLVTDAFDLDFTAGYTDAYYTSVSQIIDQSGGPPVILATKGDRLPGSPWTFSLGAQYNTDVAGHESFLRLEYEFASRETGLTPERDQATTLFDDGLVPEPETNIVTLRAGSTFGSFNVTMFADNLLNSHPQLNLTHQDSDTLLFEATTLRPRTIGINATYRY